MEFVWMKHDGVENPAKVPASAVPHWSGHGWTPADPPPKPTRPMVHLPEQSHTAPPADENADLKTATAATATTKRRVGAKED